MFEELSFRDKDQWIPFPISYIFHLILIVGLLYFSARTPRFVGPHLIKAGTDAGGTQLYWLQGNLGSKSSSRTRKPATSNRLVLQENSNVRISRHLPRKKSNKTIVASTAGTQGNASLNGEDIRPAIPIVTSDPVITAADLGATKGNVVVEITIDSHGAIVAAKIVRGLGRALDQKVLAAAESWRFRPAMKDGRPIPSKQDLYYHYPVNDGGTAAPLGATLSAGLAQSPCPILLVSAKAAENQISITFMNMDKRVIRQLEFNCGPSRSIIGKVTDRPSCREDNALFFPGQEYTLDYGNHYASRQIQVSVKSVILSDGYVWRPSRTQSCRVLTVDVDQPVH